MKKKGRQEEEVWHLRVKAIIQFALVSLSEMIARCRI